MQLLAVASTLFLIPRPAAQRAVTTRTGFLPSSIRKMPTTRKRSYGSAIAAAGAAVEKDEDDVSNLVSKLLADASIEQTHLKSNWCLRQGLYHVASSNNQSLLSLMEHQGAPSVYKSIHPPTTEIQDDDLSPTNCFMSLCRIVAGQQLAGSAAQAIWRRLLQTVDGELTPERILAFGGTTNGLDSVDDERFRKPAGLSQAKARSILDLARRFHSGELNDELLQNSSDDTVREALLKVRGLGPWSCDMFLIFYLEKPNVLPIGDLGVRKGLARHFGVRGSAKNGALCPKKDLPTIEKIAAPYEPYRSLLSYYMWKACDTVDFYSDKKKSTSAKKSSPKKASSLKRQKK